MKLSEKVKNQIIEILDGEEFKSNMYEGLEPEKRKELGQFYTPGKLCAQMLEMYESESLVNKNILDPTCGSGNLLIACLIAGADSDKLFGNEYDPIAVELCRKRINRCCDILGKPHISDYQIHQGNALSKRCLTEFNQEYLDNFDTTFIDDPEYYNSANSWELTNKIFRKKLTLRKAAEVQTTNLF